MLMILLQMNNYKAGALEMRSFNWQQAASNVLNIHDNADVIAAS